MPVSANPVTVAQYFEPEAAVDLVTEITVNASAQILLPTPTGQNDNRMTQASFGAWMAGTGDLVYQTGGYVIAVGAVKAPQLDSGAVTTDKILDLNVTAGKLATDSVETAKIVDGNVTLAKLAADAATDLSTTATATENTVVCSTGTNAVIGAVGVNAGLMIPADKTKLDGLTNYVHPDHTGHVTSVADGPTTIQPDVITGTMIQSATVALANLAPDAVTNLTTTNTATDITVNCSTGTNSVLLLADDSGSGNAGLMTASEKSKLTDTVLVTDSRFSGGADPTGGANSTPAIQAAIDYAETNLIGRVVFPRGTYRVDSQINLPISATGVNRRITLELGNSTITTANNIKVFARDITTDTDTEPRYWMVTIENGTFTQTGAAGTGTAIHIEKCSNVVVRNIRCSSFNHCVRLAFCLHHLVESVNCTGCLEAFSAVDGAEEYTTAAASNSNQGTWILCRTQTTNIAARGFYFKGAANITLINPTVEGTNVSSGYFFDAETPAAVRTGKRRASIINGWFEFDSTTGNVADAIVVCRNHEKTTFFIEMNGASIPDTAQVVRNDNSIRCIFDIKCGSLLADIQGNTTPWFDANILATASQKNVWRFYDNILFTGNRINDPARWVSGPNGDVPPHPFLIEQSFDYNGANVYDSYLTSPANTLLLNSDPTNDAIVKPTQIGGLPPTTSGGALLLAQDAGGNLAHLPASSISSTSRKADADVLPDFTTGTLSVDWDAGNYDNKQVTLAADALTVAFTATRNGTYNLHVKQDATGFRKLFLTNVNTSPQLLLVPLNPLPSSETILKFDYNAASGVWSW